MKDLDKKDVVTLAISSWVGISGGASHAYGHLKGYANNTYDSFLSVTLERKLSTSDAKKLNKLDKSDYKYEKGDFTERFDTEEQLIKEAIKKWKVSFPNAKILVKGAFAYVEPKVILDGLNKKVINRLNKIQLEYQKELDENVDDFEKCDPIYDRWIDAVLKEMK